MNRIELICIGCPMGCNLEVEISDKEVTKVTGNMCPRGITYAEKECTNPTRIVTSSVWVEGGEFAVVSVKTEHDIPKDKVFECVKALKGVIIKAPISIGDVVLENFAGTGVNIVATKRVRLI